MMEINFNIDYLQQEFNDILRKELNNIVFLELNKDLFIRDNIKLYGSTLLPIKVDDLVDGIKESRFYDNISFQQIVDAMVYVIACDKEFKYNNTYIDILKSSTEKIDTYLMGKALEYSEKGSFIDALIHFIVLDKISDNHKFLWYNIGLLLKEQAGIIKEGSRESQYELYYKMSLCIFKDLIERYPDFAQPYYILGFYLLNEEKYLEAIEMWEKSFILTKDGKFRREILKLIESTKEKSLFEESRQQIVEGDVMQGLAKIIPLVQKHEDWSEAKYYTALGYRKLCNFKKAELLLNELLESGESFHEIYNELGICYLELGNIGKAVNSLETAVKLSENNAAYYCNLAVAYYYADDSVKAKGYLNKALELNPHDEVTAKCMEWINKEM